MNSQAKVHGNVQRGENSNNITLLKIFNWRLANLTILEQAPKWLLTKYTRDQFLVSVKYFAHFFFQISVVLDDLRQL